MEFANSTDDLEDLVGIAFPGAEPSTEYRLERILGDGAQGVVFRAVRTTDIGQETVCAKVFRPSFVAGNPELAELVLQKESLALRRLGEQTPPTPFVVRMLEGGSIQVRTGFQAHAIPWLALEYVHGGPLGTTLFDRVLNLVDEQNTGFDSNRTRRVLSCVAQGMNAIHQLGIVHRDLKPTNVLMCGTDDDELAKISDFGIARPQGMLGTFGDFAVGTPGYASPEQLEGKPVGPWSDVYSLAALLYFVLTGEDVFHGTLASVLIAAKSGRIKPLEEHATLASSLRRGKILSQLNDSIARGLRPDPRDRFASVDELWAAFDGILAESDTKGVATTAVTSVRAHDRTAAVPWRFEVVHQPAFPMKLRAVSFDPDGHALATGEDGMFYWNSSQWVPIPIPSGVVPGAILALKRLAPNRWMACGTNGFLCVFTPKHCEWAVNVAEGQIHLTSMVVLSERYFALLGKSIDGTKPPQIVMQLDGKWRPLVPVPFASVLSGIGVAEISQFVVVGQALDGQGLWFSFNPMSGEFERQTIASNALKGVGIDSRGVVFAVGAGGYAFRKRDGEPELERVQTRREMSVVDIDPADCIWAGARGRILRRLGRADGESWNTMWVDDGAQHEFVSIAALSSMVMAAAGDGSIVVGHQDVPSRRQ